MTPLTHVAIHPDRELLAVASSEGWLGVWLPLDNRLVSTHALGQFINKAGWTHDGARLLATGGDTLHVLSTDGSTRLGEIATGHDRLQTFATHPSRPLAATTGHDGKARLWDLTTCQLVREVLADQQRGGGTAIEMLDNAVIVGYESGRFAACDLEDNWITGGSVFGAALSAIAASPDGESVLLASHRGGMFRMSTTEPEWPTKESWNHPPRPIATNTIAFDRASRPRSKFKERFVTALSDDTAVVYPDYRKLLGDTLGRPFHHDRKPWEQAFIVSAACFVAKHRVATSHFTGVVKLWDDRRPLAKATVHFDDQPRWDREDPIGAWTELISSS